MTPASIQQEFAKFFKKESDFIVKAPGRINLIGEHTDYNDGFVLPAAIDKAIYFAVSQRTDNQINIYATDLNDSINLTTNSLKKTEKGWANFLVGVMVETFQNQALPNGFDVAFGGDIPLGAGLSSSAAVESGIVYTLNQLFDLKLEKKQMALIAQAAEHNFAGVKCGIMDMFASIHGKNESVIRLDCRDLSYEYFPFHAPNHTLILCNTGVKHNLGDSEYNKRRAECEEGVRVLQEAFPQINSLRDADMNMLRSQTDKLSDVVFRRCKYVITEIERVPKACEALLNDDLVTFGKFMYETHDGLQNDYEVSCEELDFLVDKTRNLDYVLGSRMMGGGFGGCTINIVEKKHAELFISTMKSAYEAKFNVNFEAYEVALKNGVEIA